MKTKAERNRAIRIAVEEFSYRQKELADHLAMHYSTISRLLNEEMSK
jgi:DNA-binding MarR family transcriptional regulator